MNPYQAGLFSAAAYPPCPVGTFQHFYMSPTVTVGIGRDMWGKKTFAFAGSRTGRDFADDAYAIPIYLDGIGHVHSGFLAGMVDMFDKVLRQLIEPGEEISAEGHSLGAPHAAIFCALCGRAGIRVKVLTQIEPPRPGFEDFCAFVRKWVDVIYAFKNARDPVVMMPEPLPFFEYAHIVPLVDLDNPATGLDPFDDHMLDVVLPGLKRWQDAQPPV